MSNAALKRHYRVVQRDKQEDTADQILETLKIKEVALVAGVIYIVGTLISFSLGYVLGKNN